MNETPLVLEQGADGEAELWFGEPSAGLLHGTTSSGPGAAGHLPPGAPQLVLGTGKAAVRRTGGGGDTLLLALNKVTSFSQQVFQLNYM